MAPAQPRIKKPQRKADESLVEWVARSRLEAEAAADKFKTTTPAKVPSKLRVKPEAPSPNPKYVPLAIWADQQFGAFAPHQNTLLRWVHEGRIQPRAVKIGRYWFVQPSAEYISF